MSLTKYIQNKIVNLKSIQYLPRWIIFSIDLFIVTSSAVFCLFILEGINIDVTPADKPIIAFCVFLLIHLLLFIYFKPYTGIIRHTTVIDSAKLFFIEAFSFIVLYVINLFYEYATGEKLFLTTALFIFIFLTFINLLVFRLLVKLAFDFFTEYTEKTHQTNVVIFRSGERAIAVANALNAEVPRKYKVQGFINPNSKNSNNTLLNLP